MEMKAGIVLAVVLMLTSVSSAHHADHCYDLRVGFDHGGCSVDYNNVSKCFFAGSKPDNACKIPVGRGGCGNRHRKCETPAVCECDTCKLLPGARGCGGDTDKCVYFAMCESNTCKILPGHCGCDGDSTKCVNSAICEMGTCRIGTGHNGCGNDSSRCVSSAVCQHDTCKCGGNLTSHEGIIISPNYPSNYPDNEHCVWNLMAPDNHHIKLNFKDFNVEIVSNDRGPIQHEHCSYDYLLLLNGTHADAPLVMMICGQGKQDPVLFHGNALQIKFVSDDWNSFSGFRIEYRFVAHPTEESEGHDGCGDQCVTPAICDLDKCGLPAGTSGCGTDNEKCVYSATCRSDSCECGNNLTRPFGVITSTNYPNDYPSGERCVWNLLAPENHVIKLTFTDFAVEHHLSGPDPLTYKNCTCDYLKLLNGTGADAPLVTTICGQGDQPPVTFAGNALQLLFVTDGSVVYSGFRIEYTFLRKDGSDDKDESSDEDESDDEDRKRR